MTCAWAHLDASYVLGALSPADRAAYEQHLGTCEECAGSVQRLAGLPGLLARVPADALTEPSSAPPVPETVLPRLTRAVRRSQRRRDVLVAGLAAAATATGLGTAFGLRERREAPAEEAVDQPGGPAGTDPSPRGTPLGEPHGVEGSGFETASLSVEPVLWGTRLDLTCSYAESYSRYDDQQRTTYALVVRTRDGADTQVGTWRALAGRTMTVTAATAASAEDISAVEIRTTSGTTVLHWTQ